MARFKKFLIELEIALWKARMPLSSWYYHQGEIDPQEVGRFNYKKCRQIETPYLWGGYDQTGWFFCDVKLPASWREEKVFFHIQGVESLLYINGVPYQGMDVNHPECLLSASLFESRQMTLAIECYAGLQHDKRVFNNAELRLLHPAGWSLFHGLKNAVEVGDFMPAESPESVSWNRFIDATIALVDPRHPGNEAFLASLEKALIFFEKGLAQFQAKLPLTVWPVGHSHIDVAWLWRIKEVQRKCGRTFSTMLRLMDEYPDFLFVQSQPALYAYTQERYPILFEEIKTRVHEGRWEPVGGMWVEADCNISSGESLVRQIVHGKRYFEKNLGVKVNTLWLPDVFGYSCALPQILKKSEIDYFFTSKLMWNEYNKFPYNAFWWQGIDGTRVLSYLMYHTQTFNCQMETKQLAEMYDQLRQRGDVDNMIMPIGWGDGGGGTTRMDLESQPWLAKAPGLPSLHNGSVKAFFKALSKKAKALPVWANELYFERHRGTYTSKASAKRWNRKCETGLREAEIWSVLAGWPNPYPQAEMEQVWRTFLTTQFHDIIPGSSIPEVYEDAQESYESVLTAAAAVDGEARKHLTARIARRGNALVVFNSLSWPRTDVVSMTLNRADDKFHIVDDHDEIVPLQILQSDKKQVQCLFLAREVPSLGYATYQIKEGRINAGFSMSRVSAQSLETPFYKVRWNDQGHIERLFDKENNRDVFGKMPGNVFETFLDYPDECEVWDLDADYRDHPITVFQPESIKVVGGGAVCTVVRLTLAGKESRIVQDIYFYQHLRRIDFKTVIQWHERRTLLKVGFPVNNHAAVAAYEIQFGALNRSLTSDTSWEKAKFEVPAQRWADLSDHEYGLALLNDCKYGYDAQPGRLRLTLLRSGYSPDAIEPLWHVQYGAPTDDGEHQLTYSIYPHSGSWQQADVVRRGQELNIPLSVCKSENSKSPAKSKTLPGRYGFIELAKGESICIETLKKAEESDDLILRVYESRGESGEAAVQFHFPVKGVQECNLLERDARPALFKARLLRFSYSPYEIKTFLLKRG